MRRRRLSKERISVTVRLLLTGTLLSAHHAKRGSDPLKQSLTKGYVGEGRHGRLASASWPRLARISRMLSSFTRASRSAAIFADAAHAPQLIGQGQRVSEESVGRLGTT